MGRWYAIPDDMVPALGQVSEYSSKIPVGKESWDVFQEDDGGSHLANDPGGVGPEIPRIRLSEPLPGC